MARLKKSFKECKKNTVFLGALLITMVFVELFLFNWGFLNSKLLRLEEQHYSINEGRIFQFDLVDGKLVAQNNDPNITFENINLPVGVISIKCTNTIAGARGQVFFRNKGEAFSEAHSIIYDASRVYDHLIFDRFLGFPKVITVSSLRFDLTNIPGDIITCNDFVINPSIPFEINQRRLASYLGLFLFAGLIAFWNTKPVKFMRYSKALSASFSLTLSILLIVKLMPLARSQNVIFIVVLSVLLFVFSLTYAFAFVMDSQVLQRAKGGTPIKRYHYEIAITVVMLITTLPLLTESYFYYDDWWGVGSKELLTKQNIITFGRPVQILIYAVFDFVNIRNAYIFKWVFLLAMIFYVIVLYRWLYAKTNNDVFSFYLSTLLGVFAPSMDLLGYTATSAICYSILFSTLAVISFEKAFTFLGGKDILKVIVNTLITVLLLFTASLTYQIGPQIVFVFLTVEIYFNAQKKSLLKKNLAFLSLFGTTNILYFLFVKFLNKFYLVEITTTRSQMVNSVQQVIEKVDFYKSVVIQSVMQVIAALTGGGFVLERYRGYVISPIGQFSGNLFFCIIIVMIFIAFLGYWFRTKNILGLLSLIVFIPTSYFVFLILSENSYLVYYAFAHISIFMFYFVIGVVTTIQFGSKGIKSYIKVEKNSHSKASSTIVASLLVICALVSNYYIRDFYINFNSTIYSFVKYSLQTAIESSDIKHIHVNGTLSPINADVYSRFVVETALKDLGENPANYVITFSRNRNFMARIEETDYKRVYGLISDADRLELDKLYTFDSTYRFYNLTTSPSLEEQKQLQQIFALTGMIPHAGSPDTLIIDLTWTDSEYYNHPK